jgi:hypothetical protein
MASSCWEREASEATAGDQTASMIRQQREKARADRNKKNLPKAGFAEEAIRFDRL